MDITKMSVSSGSDITIPIQDSPPPPPSPYANGGDRSKDEKLGVSNVSVIDSDNGGGKKTPEPRGDVTVTVGFVNEAYQDQSPGDIKEEKKPSKNGKNGAISISVSGTENLKGQLNGGDHTEIALNEAVNPELINMNILSTIPDKPNPEFGPYDNLDEYFVPVNQHKKFLRSEKLYVTKDKRKETRWKKYVCWLIGASILATIVTAAVLAGVGFFPQKPSDRYTESVVGTTPGSPSSSAPTDIIISSSENSLPSSTEINTPPSVPLDAIYVPNAAKIQFHIQNLNYSAALNDKTSERFQQLATEVQVEVKDILKTRAGVDTAYSRVLEFAPGSVLVVMNIGWISQDMDYSKVASMLSNVTSVGQYAIKSMSTYTILNDCKFKSNNGCSQTCSYDYVLMDFYCSCDETMYALEEDNKTCRPLFGTTTSTTTTTTEEPLPELSSSVSYLPEDSSPPSQSEETPVLPEEEATGPPVPVEEPQPTELPHQHEHTHPTEHDHTHSTGQDEHEQVHPTGQDEHEHVHQTGQDEIETATDSMTHGVEETVSQHRNEDIFASVSSTTSTEHPVEESSEHDHHEGHHIVPIFSETTTSTTTEPSILPDSSEETRSSEVEQSQATPAPEQETETHAPVEEHLTSQDNLHQPIPTEQVVIPEEEITKTEARSDFESIQPTDVPEQPEQTHHVSPSGESGERIVPTEFPEETHTTVVPESHEEVNHEQITGQHDTSQSQEQSLEHVEPSSTESVSQEMHETHEVTTIVPGSETVKNKTDEEVVEATTVVPEVVENQKPEEDQHHITPMDVLNFSSEPSSTTPTNETVLPRQESEEGRSLSSSSESLVEGLDSESLQRLQSLLESTSQSGEESMTTEANIDPESLENTSSSSRMPRVYSTEFGSASAQLIPEDDTTRIKNREREEIIPMVPQSQNVTESASIETADEKPESAVVTSASSEDASRETVTQVNENIPVLSVQPTPTSNESREGSASGSVDSESVEATTVPPFSLIHDTDVNYVANVTEDPIQSEPVAEVETVLTPTDDKDKEKLVEEVVQTTTTPISPNSDETSREVIPVEPVVPVPVLSSTSAESESLEETTRSITSEVVDNDESPEASNRDHRDAEKDIETPFTSSSQASGSWESNGSDSASLEESAPITTTTPVVSISNPTTPASTTVSTTVSTTTTTTTLAPPTTEITSPAPVEVSSSTTTTPAPVSENSSIDNNHSSNLSSLSQESLSPETQNSQSREETSPELFDSSTSSSSHEARELPESPDSSSSDDVLGNELT